MSVAFAGLAQALPPVRARAPGCLARCSATEEKRVLVVNTDGGGHGIIGPHLAEALLTKGHRVDVRQSGAPDASISCERYHHLEEAFPERFAFTYGPADTAAVPGGKFDAIYDNCSKKPGDANVVIRAAKQGAELFYVSSAGAYSYDPNVAPHLSGNDAAGPTIDVEKEMRAAGVSTACFRPIYIIGPQSSKREYSDFFFDRIVRGRPIPIPGHPSNLVSITDVRDVASMMACALGKGFQNVIFNSVAPRAISVEGIVRLCSKVAGVEEAEIVAYDPSEAEKSIPGFKVKKAFPYRPRHFYADPFLDPVTDDILGWNATCSSSQSALYSAFEIAYGEYLDRKLEEAPVDFTLDDQILNLVSVSKQS